MLKTYFFGQEDEEFENAPKHKRPLLKSSRTLPEISNFIRENSQTLDKQVPAKTKSSLGNLVRETKSYILDFVLDASDTKNQKISIQEAKKRGILNVEKGLYVDVRNKNATMPIDEAIRLGLVGARVTICEKNFINDVEAEAKCESYEARTSTLTIDSVLDPKSSRYVSISDALRMDLLDQTNLSYINTLSGEIMSLNEAFVKGFVKGNQFHENGKIGANLNAANKNEAISNEVVEEKCVQIESFLNPLTQTRVSLQQAIELGIFDKEKGLFVHPLNGKIMNLNDALKMGFLQTTNKQVFLTLIQMLITFILHFKLKRVL